MRKRAKKLARFLKKYLARKARKGTDPPMNINRTHFRIKYIFNDHEDIIDVDILYNHFMGFWRHETTYYRGTGIYLRE